MEGPMTSDIFGRAADVKDSLLVKICPSLSKGREGWPEDQAGLKFGRIVFLRA